jgi:hypothetical protein
MVIIYTYDEGYIATLVELSEEIIRFRRRLMQEAGVKTRHYCQRVVKWCKHSDGIYPKGGWGKMEGMEEGDGLREAWPVI